MLQLPRWMHDHYLWQRIVNALHSVYRTGAATGIEDELKYLAELDFDRQQQRYSLVRILIWATPMLGFLGTVLGISQALGGINGWSRKRLSANDGWLAWQFVRCF